MIYVKVAYLGPGYGYWLIRQDGFAAPTRSKQYRTAAMARAAGNRARKRYMARLA